MTDQATGQQAPQRPGGARPTPQEAPWLARGSIVFAGLLMILSGIFDAIDGVVALFTNEFYVSTPRYVFQFDATSWGVIHLLLGALVAVAGFAVLAGQTWGRVVGIVLVGLSAVANFAFIPYYPFWSLAIIALDVVILWALATHGRNVRI
jgi:phosphatidylserine synthase